VSYRLDCFIKRWNLDSLIEAMLPLYSLEVVGSVSEDVRVCREVSLCVILS